MIELTEEQAKKIADSDLVSGGKNVSVDERHVRDLIISVGIKNPTDDDIKAATNQIAALVKAKASATPLSEDEIDSIAGTGLSKKGYKILGLSVATVAILAGGGYWWKHRKKSGKAEEEAPVQPPQAPKENNDQ